MLDVQSLNIALGKKSVVTDVSFQAARGEIIAIIGPNGAGKTSLMKALAGLIPFSKGSVTLDYMPLETMTLTERSTRLAYLPQGYPLHWPLKVSAVTALGRETAPIGKSEKQAGKSDPYKRKQQNTLACKEALQKTGLWEKRSRSVNSLSGGEQARAHLSRLFASESPLWLLDEPVSSLDPFYQKIILTSLLDAKKAGRTIIVILHDLYHARLIADHILALDKKQIGFGPCCEILSPCFLEKLYGLTLTKGLQIDLSSSSLLQ